MSSGAIAADEYWGYLIKEDKSPSPVFEQLLLGIANYINRQIAPWDTNCLIPSKLAAYYRLIGGDYDTLFLETPQPSLSFIYQSLGCYHTLQPQADPYIAPSVPALTPQGFVRWQTVQLLLEPEEHVPLLQTAVKRFDLANPIDGQSFPSWLPRAALPSKPDREMVQWHETVSNKLMLEAQASQRRSIPSNPTHHRELSDGLSDGTIESSRDSWSRGSSTTDDRSLVDAAHYFSEPRPRPFFRPPEPLHTLRQPRTTREPAPWSPERRRSNSDPNLQHFTPSTWTPRDELGRHKTIAPNAPRQRPRPRSPSTISTSSTSSSTSTSSDESHSAPYHHRSSSSSTTTLQPRRHSSHQRYDQRSPHTPRATNPSQSVPPRHHQQPTNQATSFPQRHPSAPAQANSRGYNVHFGADSVHDISPGRDRAGGKNRAKSEERPAWRSNHGNDYPPSRRGGGTANEDDDNGPVRGVGGRRYPTGSQK